MGVPVLTALLEVAPEGQKKIGFKAEAVASQQLTGKNKIQDSITCRVAFVYSDYLI